MSCIPRQELQQIFNVFAKELPDEFQKNYIEIVGSLIGNNFNIQNAAKRCLCIRIHLLTVTIKSGIFCAWITSVRCQIHGC